MTFRVQVESPPICAFTLGAEWGEIDGSTGRIASHVPSLPGAKARTVPISFGRLEPGYYTASFDVLVESAVMASAEVRFAVLVPSERRLEEVLAGRYRFGLKKWNRGPGTGMNKRDWNEREAADASVRLALPWTRELFNQDAHLPISELAESYPVGIVQKIERFPRWCFDEDRYGAVEEWEARHGRGRWARATLPMERPYKTWLAAELANAPPGQKIFEIWNEPWGKMPPMDFATLCSWVLETVRRVVPDAVVGPNIGNNLDPSSHDRWDERFIRAGGLDGMDFVAVHPYTSGTPERKGFRQRLRNYRDYLRGALGRELEIYVTEFGWSSAPGSAAKRVVSEVQQAQRTVRQALMLYAEDVRIIIPHVAGQSESNRNEREDWFGFFSLDGEPKPVAVAFGTAARMIDGSKFVGDLWFGSAVGAMLFDNEGVFTLALWTEGSATELSLAVGNDVVTTTYWMGRSVEHHLDGEDLTVSLSGAVTYVTGVTSELADQVISPSEALRDDRWQERGQPIVVRKGSAPVIDGLLGEWEKNEWRAVNEVGGLYAGEDVRVALRWSGAGLHGAIRIVDEQVTPPAPGEGRHHSGDRVLIGLSGRPSRQVSGAGFAEITLAINAGLPVDADRSAIKGPNWKPATISPLGISSSTCEVPEGWIAEFSISPKVIGLDEFTSEDDLTFNLRTIDQDGAGTQSRPIGELAPRAPNVWPRLDLDDSAGHSPKGRAK